jgi:hypothetical protein
VPRGTQPAERRRGPSRHDLRDRRQQLEREWEAMHSRLDSLLARIRGEYQEMPGLRLTRAQACRLWQVDPATCEVVLQTLLAEGFLARTTNGMFVASPAPEMARVKPLKAAIALTPSPVRQPA